MSIASPVALFGELRGGAFAVGYHLLYAALFTVMGVALWRLEPWGLAAVLGGTAFYTLDRCLYLFDAKAREKDLAHSLHGLGGVLRKGTLLEMTRTTTILVLASWWIFALYTWFKRGAFKARPSP